MPKFNHPNFGDIQKHAYLKGTILEVYGSSEKDPAHWDTADINIALDSGDISGVHIPLFYHCSHDVEKRNNGALEGAFLAFLKDDEVIVQCEITSYGHYKPLRVMGFMDKPKVCGWIEDWEGETITSNHPWTYLTPYGGGCSGASPDATVYSFGNEQVAKLEVEASTANSLCRADPGVILRVLPETPLNLKIYSGFECKAYLAEFTPQTFTQAGCFADCVPGWDIRVHVGIDFDWRPVGSLEDYTDWGEYGFEMNQWCYAQAKEGGGYTCKYISYGEAETFDIFLNRIDKWSTLPKFDSSSEVPWLNGNYELTAIYLNCSMVLYHPDALMPHGNINMKVYFSDIIIK